MTIEVRQMIVKTSVVHRSGDDEDRLPRERERGTAPDMRQILEQCRRLVVDMLRERRER